MIDDEWYRAWRREPVQRRPWTETAIMVASTAVIILLIAGAVF